MKTKKREHTTATNPPLPPAAFDATPRLALVLTDEAIYLTRFGERGEPLETHPVAANDVARAFNLFTASTGLLPPDILFWKSRSGSHCLAIWIPAAVHALTFSQGRHGVTLKVPLPGFVFIGEGVRYGIFAAKERPTKASDQLYHAPLPNVYGDGNICVGTVQFPKASAENLRLAATLFFESVFNADLSTDKIKSQVGDRDEDDPGDDDMDGEEIADDDIVNLVREPEGPHEQQVSLFQFLQGLQHKREFPADELVPLVTVGQLLAGVKQ